jgi:hypothetical protein
VPCNNLSLPTARGGYSGDVHRRILGVADVVEPATGNQLGRVGLPDSQDVTASAAQASTAQVPKQPADHGDPR